MYTYALGGGGLGDGGSWGVGENGGFLALLGALGALGGGLVALGGGGPGGEGGRTCMHQHAL